jgi:hypothetical protein
MSVTAVTDWTVDESPCDLCARVARCREGMACEVFESFLTLLEAEDRGRCHGIQAGNCINGCMKT